MSEVEKHPKEEDAAKSKAARSARLDTIKNFGKSCVKTIGLVHWMVWTVVFLLLLIFQNNMAQVLKTCPVVQWGLLLLTLLIGIIGLIRILVD